MHIITFVFVNMTRPRRSSAELCRSKQRRCKRIWIACAMSPRVVKKTADSGEPPLAAAQMGRATAREVEGSWGIHSTLTAWSLWPSSWSSGRSTWALGFGVTLVTWLVDPGVSRSLEDTVEMPGCREQERGGLLPGLAFLEDAEKTTQRRKA